MPIACRLPVYLSLSFDSSSWATIASIVIIRFIIIHIMNEIHSPSIMCMGGRQITVRIHSNRENWRRAENPQARPSAAFLCRAHWMCAHGAGKMLMQLTSRQFSSPYTGNGCSSIPVLETGIFNKSQQQQQQLTDISKNHFCVPIELSRWHYGENCESALTTTTNSAKNKSSARVAFDLSGGHCIHLFGSDLYWMEIQWIGKTARLTP